MKCPACQYRAVIIDTRSEGSWRRRRYECRCGERFTTAEFIVWRGKSPGKKGGPSVVQAWVEMVKQQGAAELIVKLDALLQPWRQRDGRPPEDQQEIPAGDAQSPVGVALVPEIKKPSDGGGID